MPSIGADTTDLVLMNAKGEWVNVVEGNYHLILEIPCYDVNIDTTNVPQDHELALGTYATEYKMRDICGNEDRGNVHIKVVEERVNYGYPNRDRNEKVDKDEHHFLTGVYFSGFSALSDNDLGYRMWDRRFPSLTAGETYNLQLTSDNDTDTRQTMYFSVWIDYNKDGDFNDPNETVFEGFSFAGRIKPTPVTIPDNVRTQGLGSTIMRVAARKYTDPHAFLDYEFGEVEDFRIRILELSLIHI